MSEKEDDDKTFDPSQRKLDEARKRGEIARAPDVNAAAAYAGLLLAALLAGQYVLLQIGAIGQSILDQADPLSLTIAQGGQAGLGPIIKAVGVAILPFFGLPFVAVALAPVLVPLSIWLYTLIFAFSSLWFTHYCLAALERLRAEGGGRPPGDAFTPVAADAGPLASTAVLPAPISPANGAPAP